MQKEIPDLVYIFPSFFSEEKIENEIKLISHPKLKIAIHKSGENSAFNALEWIVPTAFGVYILKPYFEGFLSEAGKDHYILLKNFINKFLEKGKEFNFTLISATQSTEKLSEKYNKSFSVSIEIQTKNNRIVKVLYENSIALEDWKIASEEILNLFKEHYKNYPKDKLSTMIQKYEDKPQRKLYITVDKYPQVYEIIDDTDMMLKFKK